MLVSKEQSRYRASPRVAILRRLHMCRKNDVKALRCLGGFRNERSDYDWNGHKIELDKTMFPHGTVFEVEVETVSLDAPVH